MKNDFYELLEQIRKKPGLYIGVPSISNLYMFLQGYQFARQQFHKSLTLQERRLREFQPWLQQKFNVKTSQSWSQLILLHSPDERSAFERFFVLWQEFLDCQPEKLTLPQAAQQLEPA